MTTKLEKPLKRELLINDEPWMLTMTPEGLKLVPKGKRNGHELAWKDIVGGSATPSSSLNASLGHPQG